MLVLSDEKNINRFDSRNLRKELIINFKEKEKSQKQHNIYNGEMMENKKSHMFRLY